MNDYRDLIDAAPDVEDPFAGYDLAPTNGHAQDTPPPVGWLTTAELLALPRPTQRWLVPGVLAAGLLHLLVAAPKAGKSTLLAFLLLAMLLGRRVLGLQATTIRSVLIVSEEGVGTLTETIHAAGLADVAGVHWFPREALASTPSFDRVLVAVRERAAIVKPDVIILDTLSRVAQVRGDSDGDNALWENVMSHLQALAVNGPAVVVVHHSAKADMEGVKRVRGATAIAAAADSILGLSRRGDFDRVLEVLGARGSGWIEAPIVYQREVVQGVEPRQYELKVVGTGPTTDAEREDDLTQRVKDALKLDPGCSFRALRQAVKVQQDKLRACLAAGVGVWLRIEQPTAKGEKARHWLVAESAPEGVPRCNPAPTTSGGGGLHPPVTPPLGESEGVTGVTECNPVTDTPRV